MVKVKSWHFLFLVKPIKSKIKIDVRSDTYSTTPKPPLQKKTLFSKKYNKILRIFSEELKCFIFGKMGRLLCQSDLVDIPQFLRFDDANLNYCCGTIPIKEKCQLIVNYLQLLKKALNGSKLITFIVGINDKCPSMFSNHLKLLNHIQEELMPICDPSHGYKFTIHFNSDKNIGANVIHQILQITPIQHCSNVEISFNGLSSNQINCLSKQFHIFSIENVTEIMKTRENL